MISEQREEQSNALEAKAHVILEALSRIEERARQELGARDVARERGGPFIASPNPMVHGDAAAAPRELRRIAQQQLEALKRLLAEPFIAVVRFRAEEGEPETLYVTRGTPLSGPVPGLDGKIASYKSPLGRLAESPAGGITEVKRPAGLCEVETVERIRLHPEKRDSQWDARDVRLEVPAGVSSVHSLRRYLAESGELQAAQAADDILGQIELEARCAENLQAGIRRRIVSRMALRDQAILDRAQGDVFRLPLDQRLMLSGPPGTGKTTTLIRRLAQKRSFEDLDEAEQEKVPAGQAQSFFHPDNWVMFAPTELLRLYLKEAFNAEGIAASEERVRTWADERKRLARNVLGILRSGGGGGFILDDSAPGLLESHADAQIEFMEAFAGFFAEEMLRRYQTALDVEAGEDRALAELLSRARRRLGSPAVFDRLFDLADYEEEVHALVERDRKAARDQLHALIRQALQRDAKLLERLGEALESLGRTSAEGEDDEDDFDATADDETTPETSRDLRLRAMKELEKRFSTAAGTLASGLPTRPSSQTGRLWEWLGPLAPPDEQLLPLGRTLARLRHLRYLGAVRRHLIRDVPAVYRSFRRHSIAEQSWFKRGERTSADTHRITGAETDAIILLMLRHARTLLTRKRGAGLEADTRQPLLKGIKGEYVTQVLVDEATDFSPLELACMGELAHPTFRSFFASGDFRQRVTTVGVSSLEHLRWVDGDFTERRISIGYRQSQRLVRLAVAIADLSGGEAPDIRPPEHFEDADVRPALGEQLQGEALSAWLCERIEQVERALRQVPSIAIFVDGDERIEPLLKHLRPRLAEHNLDVVGCPDGRVVGAESQIRVFDVQHIKGLEFEAVFFVGVDDFATRLPELCDKFLYVGITRAATYLGVTCSGLLPKRMDPLREHFTSEPWAAS